MFFMEAFRVWAKTGPGAKRFDAIPYEGASLNAVAMEKFITACMMNLAAICAGIMTESCANFADVNSYGTTLLLTAT